MRVFIKKVINNIPFLKNEIDFYLFKKRYNHEENILKRKQMTSFYSQFIKEGDLCFDIGGNIGDFTQAFIDCGAKVICLEPQKYCFSLLNKRFKKNKKVVLIKKGVGAEEGEMKLYLTASHTIASMSTDWINKVKQSGRFSEFSWTKSEIVQITTLDKLIDMYGKPHFCKIDVEGYEYEVIKGLSKNINYISLEFTYELLNNTIKIIEHMSSLGKIELNYMQGLTLGMSYKDWVEPSVMILFLKSSPKDSIGDVFFRFK